LENNKEKLSFWGRQKS